jgi:hypothetical protein
MGFHDTRPVQSNFVVDAAVLQLIVPKLQWPAMAASIVAAWLVASQSSRRRNHGFWWFLASNILWTIWVVQDGARAIVVFQFALAALNLHGAKKYLD